MVVGTAFRGTELVGICPLEALIVRCAIPSSAILPGGEGWDEGEQLSRSANLSSISYPIRTLPGRQAELFQWKANAEQASSLFRLGWLYLLEAKLMLVFADLFYFNRFVALGLNGQIGHACLRFIRERSPGV